MKKSTLFIPIIVILFLVSCKSASKESNQSKNQTQEELIESKKFKITTDVSTIEWKCGKLVGGEHNGNVTFKDGILNCSETKLLNGKLTIDMKSITNKDITNKDKNANLIAHLKSADFFDVEKYPTVSIDIIKVEEAPEKTTDMFSKITANVTIKGVTKEISFYAIVKISDSVILTTASIKINRKDWGINYGSEGSVADMTKDKIINDNIDLVVSIAGMLEK